MSPVIIIATFCVFPGKENEFISAAEGLMEKMRSHRGILFHSLQQDCQDPCSFIFYEQYESEQALAEHGSSPEIAAWRALLPGLAVRLYLRKYSLRSYVRTVQPVP